MSHQFTSVKLGEIAKFSQGIQVPIGKQEKSPRPDTHIRFIRIVDYTQQTKDIRYVVHPGDRYVVDESDLVMVRYGAIGVVGTGIRGAIANNMFKVTPNSQDIDKRFLYNCLRSKPTKDKLIAANSSTTMPAITFAMAADIDIPLPDLPTQKKIAGILSAYDNLIENNLRRIQILEEMAQSLYREWFVHFRFPGHESTQFKDSPLGPIPQDWKVKRFGDVVTLNYGKALKKNDRKGGNVPVFGSSGIVGYHDKLLCEGPGLIVGRKGNVGSVFWSPIDFYVIDTAYFATSHLPLRYLLFVLPTLNFVNSDAAVPGLSRNQAYALDIAIPSSELLEKFCRMAEAFGEHIESLKSRNDNLRKTRDLLLPKLLSPNAPR